METNEQKINREFKRAMGEIFPEHHKSEYDNLPDDIKRMFGWYPWTRSERIQMCKNNNWNYDEIRREIKSYENTCYVD